MIDTPDAVRVEKLVFGGQGLAHEGDAPVFLWNVLPGELVEYEVTKKRRGVVEGIATNVINASPDRIEPSEPWYLSTSPWSMMTFEAEQNLKLALASEAYDRTGGIKTTLTSCVANDQQHGYRNKMEFSFFTEIPESDIELAFYQRGKRWKIPVTGSALAEPVINDVARTIRDWLRAEGVDRRKLKTVIVRSDGAGKAIAALFVKEPIQFSTYPACEDSLVGLQIYFSEPRSPASVPTELLYASGASQLTTKVGGLELTFGALSFFQVNVPVFEQALGDIRAHIGENETVIDYYSGVGSIGLSLARTAKTVTLIESNEEATMFAKENVENNKIANASVVHAEVEKTTEFLRGDATVIVDPPRAGLHKKVAKALTEIRPKKLVYLSCNLSTQARDLAELKEAYRIIDTKIYNFFPRTPHIEGLVVLERKA